MKHIITFSLSLLMLVLVNCKQKTPPVHKITKFKVVEIQITENGVKNIQNCANWYLDFTRIKRTVLYKGKIICVGQNGGFACLNFSDFKQDTVLENKMNTDFFTNAIVYQDTLFAEKFGNLFFWNSDKWVEYLNVFPLDYFNLLFEDKSYAFYSYCGGEFGSILFVYNKATKTTKADFTTCPNSVIKTNLGYYVGTHLYHLSGSSYSYIIKDIEKLKVFPDSFRNKKDMLNLYQISEIIQDTGIEARNNYTFLEFSLSKNAINPKLLIYGMDVIITASFFKNRKMYHIFDVYGLKNRNQLFIGTVLNDSLQITDTLYNFYPSGVFQYGDITIFGGYGFSMLRNDTIFKVTFNTLHPNYHGPKLQDYNLTTDQSKKPSANVEYTYNLSADNNWTIEPGRPKREIEFTFKNKYKIIGHYGNEQDGNYIYTNSNKTKLKFQDRKIFLANIFVYDKRLFLFFKNLGNPDYKYGLIEITDIQNFAKKYGE